MSYVRKTVDVWDVETNYGYGWECETTEDTRKEAAEMAQCYRENSYGRYIVRIRKRREYKTQEQRKGDC